MRAGCRLPAGDAPAWIEAAWLAFAALVLLAAWVGALSPDFSWDGLAYHLPEARDIARLGRVAVRPDLVPHSLLWRNHDAYLSLGFFYGGERVMRLLQFAVGVAVFGAALALARRLRQGGSAALVVLALAAFPLAMLQLRATYVDWPAAFLVTAAAAELASGRAEGGRLRLSGFLFGGAVATKVFALGALPALLILLARARPRPAGERVAGAFACALAALGPWLAWSSLRAGSIAAPYAASPAELVERVASGHYFRTSPASGAAAPARPAGARLRAFAALPYDLVFHSSRFEGNGDGYNGILVLVLLAGLAAWDARRIVLFCIAAVPWLVPWSLLSLPSIRYLFPVFPLYVVFCAEGLRRLTGRFAGAWGAAAGVALLGAAAAFPVQFGSSGLEWRVAAGGISREESLAARLPGYRLWQNVTARDRVLFVGENDRFHCPARRCSELRIPPGAAWGRDPAAWRSGLDQLHVTHVLYRSDRRRDGPPEGPRRPARARPPRRARDPVAGAVELRLPNKMTEPIRFRETSTESASVGSELRDAVALRLDPSRRVMLRFQIALESDDEMEALRYARRSMIRDERTRGLDWDEPSMEDLTVMGAEIRWFVWPPRRPGAGRR